MQWFIAWSPVPDLPIFCECFAKEANGELKLLFQTEATDGRELEVTFLGNVPAYRSIVEECRLGPHARLDEHSQGLSCFWRVSNSDWIASFSEADLIHYPDLHHYLFETSNQCVDVLTNQEPQVSWRSQRPAQA